MLQHSGTSFLQETDELVKGCKVLWSEIPVEDAEDDSGGFKELPLDDLIHSQPAMKRIKTDEEEKDLASEQTCSTPDIASEASESIWEALEDSMMDPLELVNCSGWTVQDCPEGMKTSNVIKQNGRTKEWNLPQSNTFLERNTAAELVTRRHAQQPSKKAQTCPSSIRKSERDEESMMMKEYRTMLGRTNSLFPGPADIRWCPFLQKGECCNQRHCELFWKPILKQEKRKDNFMCPENCGFCHDPRHFPDEEWVKLHISRTPAARRRRRQKTAKQIAANKERVASV